MSGPKPNPAGQMPALAKFRWHLTGAHVSCSSDVVPSCEIGLLLAQVWQGGRTKPRAPAPWRGRRCIVR